MLYIYIYTHIISIIIIFIISSSIIVIIYLYMYIHSYITRGLRGHRERPAAGQRRARPARRPRKEERP